MKNGLFFWIGVFLVVAVGAPTADGGHFNLGISIALVGLVFMALSDENLCNPKFLRRQFRALIWTYFGIK